MALDVAQEIATAQIPQRVLWSTVTNFVGKFITLGAGFLLTPFILHRLGSTTYGLWALIGSLVAYGSLLDLGIGGAVTKHIAEYLARDETERAHRLVATTLRLYAVLGLIAVVLSLAAAPILPRIFDMPTDQRATGSVLIVLMGVSVGISLPCTTSMAVLRGLQRYDVVNLINVAGTLLSVGATVGMLLLGGGVLGLVAVSIPITLGLQIASILFVRRIRPDLRFGWHGADRALIRPIVSFSSSLFLMDVAGRIQTKTDEIVIGVFLPISAVTPYAIARRLSDMGQILTNQFLKVLLPFAAELHAQNDHARLRSLYITSTRLALTFFLPVGCAIIILGRPILIAWVGPTYAGDVPIIAILTLASLIEILVWSAGSILPAMARHRPVAIVSIFSALANLALSIALVTRVGVIGVALGTLIPTTIECVGFVLPYAMRVIGIRAAVLVKEILLPTFLPAVPTALALTLMERAIKPSSLFPVGLIGGVGILVYAAVYLCVGASRVERQVYRGVVAGLVSRLPNSRGTASRRR